MLALGSQKVFQANLWETYTEVLPSLHDFLCKCAMLLCSSPMPYFSFKTWSSKCRPIARDT